MRNVSPHVAEIVEAAIARKRNLAIAVGVLQANDFSITGFGRVDETGAIPVAIDLFEIGSVTKVFTATILAWGCGGCAQPCQGVKSKPENNSEPTISRFGFSVCCKRKLSVPEKAGSQSYQADEKQPPGLHNEGLPTLKCNTLENSYFPTW